MEADSKVSQTRAPRCRASRVGRHFLFIVGRISDQPSRREHEPRAAVSWRMRRRRMPRMWTGLSRDAAVTQEALARGHQGLAGGFAEEDTRLPCWLWPGRVGGLI